MLAQTYNNPEVKKAPEKPKTKLEERTEALELRFQEVPEAAAEIMKGVEDGLEVSEIARRVSEVVGEKVSEDSLADFVAKAKAKRATTQDIKAKLLENPPPEETMKAEITREVNNEIKQLEKKANRIRFSAAKANFFELNNIIKKIRELKNILASLVSATYEALKSLWLKFVHGIL